MALRSRFTDAFPYRRILQKAMLDGARWIAAPKPSLPDDGYDERADRDHKSLRNLEPVFDAANVLRADRDLFFLESNSGNALGAAWPAILPALLEAGTHVIVDHLGQPDLDAGVSQPGFDAVLRLAREGDAIVKLSGGPRMSRRGLPYADMRPFVERAVEVFGIERCLWGSDWPFLGVTARPRYADVLQALETWLPSEADRKRVLWENPARLFGFATKPGP